MKSTQNPEQGRLNDEAKAERLREARKKTAEMKRQYRDMRREGEAKERAARWAERHKESHTDTFEDMAKVSRVGKPLNRRSRRKFAKKMNVFKTGAGWQHFNQNYIKRYGLQEPQVGKAQEKVVVKSNITQALEAARKEKEI